MSSSSRSSIHSYEQGHLYVQNDPKGKAGYHSPGHNHELLTAEAATSEVHSLVSAFAITNNF